MYIYEGVYEGGCEYDGDNDDETIEVQRKASDKSYYL